MPSLDLERKLLFLIPEDWYVCSHRLPLIVGAKAAGLEVTVVTRVDKHEQPMLDAGATVVAATLRRGFRHPLQDMMAFLDLLRIYRRQQPDIVHHVTPKSCLYGSLAAYFSGVSLVINAMAGLGYLYTSKGLKARLARPLVTQAFKLLLSRPAARVIVQNQEDHDFFCSAIGLRPEKVVLIRGSGVDIEKFRPVPAEPSGKIRICLAVRMIREKGLFETVAAARRLLEVRQDLEFVFAGDPDVENPSGVSADQLQAWHDEGVITWLGRVEDVPAVLNSCHIGILPSYREGLPKSLLEAAACGLPLIATDATGCREICLDRVNRLQVKPRDVESIVTAVTTLADDP